MLKGDELEPQSWLRCPVTCVGQDATPNSNLAGAILILYLNLLTGTRPTHVADGHLILNEKQRQILNK